MKTIQSHNHLIKIKGTIAYMNPKYYIQKAQYNSTTDRYYVSRGVGGGLSISAKRCTLLACGVVFL